MDIKRINPFIEATLHVLDMVASAKAEAEKPYLKKESVAKGDVSGVSGLTGDATGMISVSFSEKCILAIVSSMFEEEMKELNNDKKDAVGEISNMISGQARQELEGLDISLQAAIPSVIMGKNYTLTHMIKQPIIALPFITPNGDSTIEVCFEEGK